MAKKLNSVREADGAFQSMFSTDYYIQPFLYFYLKYKTMPNRVVYGNINTKSFFDFMLSKHKLKNDEIIRSEKFNQKTKQLRYDNILLDLREHCILYFYVDPDGNSQVEVIYGHETKQAFLSKLKTDLLKFANEHDGKSELNLICKYGDNLSLTYFEINNQKIDLSMNYNDDFIEVDQIIKERLNKPKDKGIVLLHGLPGTGKTSYIRYLIKCLDKKIIYLPPDLAMEIGRPSFLTFLTDNPDSVLIIEDAENIIVERTGNMNLGISNLLNLCDGLLGDCLNIQVVCSFNTDLSRIDNALLRKGRLIAKYKFEKLDSEKAQILSDSLGYKTMINTSMCLSDIYNQDEKDFTSAERVIGFGNK